MRMGHMRHQGDAGREKARVVSRSVDGGGEFRRESARDGGDVDSHLFEDAALHQPLHAAPARTSVRIAPLPWREGESAWRIGRLILDPLELGADPVAKRFEPGAWALLDRKRTRMYSSNYCETRMPSSARKK